MKYPPLPACCFLLTDPDGPDYDLCKRDRRCNMSGPKQRPRTITAAHIDAVHAWLADGLPVEIISEWTGVGVCAVEAIAGDPVVPDPPPGCYWSQLEPETFREVQRLLRTGLKVQEVARRCGVSGSPVCAIRDGRAKLMPGRER